ncbi:BnaA04g24810D [Brassica napus]|uniref:BnaA04g24810D protein n=1 Tax=Brassica napus TaxID=3708 RepID=A0A078GV42_BRANA|nr:BnaA04g24810D [Brassica napus]
MILFTLSSHSLTPPRTFHLQVKVLNWINDVKGSYFTGFGASLPSKARQSRRLHASLVDPPDSCYILSSRLDGRIALSFRGNCEKAKHAEAAGASALLVINVDRQRRFLVCVEKDTSLNVTIPVLMISKSSGYALYKSMLENKSVELLLYAPTRPAVDFAAGLLLLMAVGTVVVGSLWSELTDPDQANESYSISSKVNHLNFIFVLQEKEILYISVTGAVFFIVTASVFLLLLFYFMSSWLVLVLIIFFCIVGMQDMHKIIMAVLLRKWRHLGRKTVKLPLIGTVSWMSVLVIIICLAFTVFWFVKRHTYYSWVGQDILGICLMITSLQVVRLPNIKVATVLLCCAFVYDIFWVFISPLIFHESVMIVVAQGDRSSGESMPMFLRIPRFFDPWGYDKFKKRVVSSGYFLCLTIGYGVGLLLTCLGLYLMDGHGQPALLYIVPCTLGLAVVMGLVRGELKELWNYGIEATESYTPEDPLPVA